VRHRTGGLIAETKGFRGRSRSVWGKRRKFGGGNKFLNDERDRFKINVVAKGNDEMDTILLESSRDQVRNRFIMEEEVKDPRGEMFLNKKIKSIVDFIEPRASQGDLRRNESLHGGHAATGGEEFESRE
jgi:hypothetical protein